jgi:adenine-specific DNA-methyltransferase
MEKTINKTIDKTVDKTIEKIEIYNRKYLGSKKRLISFIEEVILSRVNKINTFIDGFAGTGVVANHFNNIADSVIANDLLYSNYVICSAFLESTENNTDLKKVIKNIDLLNLEKIKEQYCFKNYGGTYFTCENAGFIDAVRGKIEKIHSDSLINATEKKILLTSLVYAADKAANTVGQYDAFLKHIGRKAYDANGSHKVDSNVYKKMRLLLPNINFKKNKNNKVYNKDLNQIIDTLKADVLYLDPPYNHRQYIDCYHVLENIVKWNKPELKGKTKKFERDHLKSSYSRKSECVSAFSNLIEKARVEHIFVSYNSEGIIPEEKIKQILEAKGKLEIFQKDYPIFGNGAGKSKKRKIIEYLYYCRVFEES